jgi:hypothetical protein
MTGEAESILQAKFAELQGRVRELWAGLEREAVIEIVRSADYAAFISSIMPADDPGRERLRLILDGVAPALATFLPKVVNGRAALPFGPATPGIVEWADSMLAEFGKIAELQRLAALERYGLSRSTLIDATTLRIEVQDDVAESMDRDAARWLQTETMRLVARMQSPPPDPKYIEELLDTTSGVQDGWFIRYAGHEDLIECYRDRAMIAVLGCAESEALAHDAMIGGRPFAEWRAICVAALGRVFNHVAYATRLRHRFPALTLRNLLTIPVRHEDARAVWIEAGDPAKHANNTISHLVLDAETIGPWQAHHEIPAPFYVDVGGGWLLLPLFGGLLNPVCGLVRTLRLRHSRDWDKAVDQREVYFRDDIKDQFSGPRFLVSDRGMTLRRDDGSHITDIDAAIIDRETGSLALIQLKWPDIFGLSPKERESKRLNLLKANEWVDRLAAWVAGRDAMQVAKALGLGEGASGSRPPLLMVIPRYTARFTLNDRLDDRACWVSWPEVVRMRVEQKEIADPLAELANSFKGGGELPACVRPADVVYKLHELDVQVAVS